MIEIESRTKPGPGAHDVERAFASISKHGDAPNLAPKIGRGKVTNFIDEECYRKKDVPVSEPSDLNLEKSVPSVLTELARWALGPIAGTT
eukprot:SAG31_NODE_510_length_14725_cov_2.829482_10_plen_90_part_00